MSDKALLARIAELEAEVAAKKAPPPLWWKVAEKGGLSVYGLGQRFPVTLYREQWVRLFAEAENILEFLEENKTSLKSK